MSYVDVMLNWNKLRPSKYRLGETVYVNFDDVWTKGRIVSMMYNDNLQVNYAVQCGMDAWFGLDKNIRKHKKDI